MAGRRERQRRPAGVRQVAWPAMLPNAALRVARTIADLAGEERVLVVRLAEALQ